MIPSPVGGFPVVIELLEYIHDNLLLPGLIDKFKFALVGRPAGLHVSRLTVADIVALELPSKLVLPLASLDNEIVLAVANLVAVAALPVQEADEPVILIPQVPVAPVPVKVGQSLVILVQFCHPLLISDPLCIRFKIG